MRKLNKKQLEALIPKIELIPIDEIQINPNNPRTLSERKFNQLVSSVTDFWQMLFLRPIVLDENNIALGGNMRTLAGRKAGFTFLPCIKATNLSDQQRAEFIIKDNVPFGDWNFDDLANNWDQELLAEWGMSLPSFAGIDQDADLEQRSRSKSQASDSGAPTLNIVLRSNSEEDRRAKINVLIDAGLKLDLDFFIL